MYVWKRKTTRNICCLLYLFQSFLAVFLRGRDELTGGDRRRRASRLWRRRLWLQLGGNYEIQKHKTDVTKYISWGRCADFITLCFCFGETETNSVDKEADYITLLKYHIIKIELNFRTIPLLLSAFCFLQNIFLHSAAVPSQCYLICIWLCSPLHRLFQK